MSETIYVWEKLVIHSELEHPPKYVGKCPHNSPLVCQAREGRSCGVCLYAYSDPQSEFSPIYGMTISQ